MTILEIARIYTDLVKAEREIPEEEPQAREKVHALRTKYHELLMAKMKEERIDFSDRFDAAAKAFDMVREEDAKYGKTKLD